MSKKYMKKPVVIDALLWEGNNKRDMCIFLGGEVVSGEAVKMLGENFFFDYSKEDQNLIIKTLEGNMIANVGDYIIKGIKGEFYPCKPDIFDLTYEEVK